MNLYHRTFAAGAIIRDGFRDGEPNRLAPATLHGVWVYDEPLDEQQGALGNVLLVIAGVPEAAVADFEWDYLDRLSSYREFLVPADVLNRFPIVAIYPDSWIWVSGNFEYVGALLDARPLLKAGHDDQPVEILPEPAEKPHEGEG
jgi:hypothetical protein